MNICQNKRDIFPCSLCILCANTQLELLQTCAGSFAAFSSLLLSLLGEWTFSKGDKTFFNFKSSRRAKSPSLRHEGGEGSRCQLCRAVAVLWTKFKSSMIWLPLKLSMRCQNPFQLCNIPVMATADHSSWATLRSRLPFANSGKFLTHRHQIWNDLYTICSCAGVSPLWRKLHGSFFSI